MTLTGTPYESLAGGCEAGGGVNPDVSINGVIVGDGSTPLSMAGISDPTGLLGELAALATTVQFSICGSAMTVAALGNNIPMVGNGQFWISPIPVAADPTTGAGQYLWAAPMYNFTIGCGIPNACNFSGDPCELSLLCSFPGCTDEGADNYDPAAGCDAGNCVTSGCTNAGATNYNAAANVDDGSCLFLVTLQVNMSEVGTSGVNIAGGFQGWDPAASACADLGGGVYEYAIALASGTYEYKFVNGSAWGDDEYVNGDCSNGAGNRTITVADAAADNGTPCFASCDACAPAVVMGCTYAAADNFNALANDDDGSCTFADGSDCPADLDNDGVAATSDLLLFLSAFGATCN